MSAKDDYAGKEGKCKCGTALIVPGNSEKMKFACRHCGKGISVSNRHAGKQAKCPTCQGIISVPVLGIHVEQKKPPQVAPLRQAPAAKPPTVSITCAMCNKTFRARQTDEPRIIECPECGSFMEVPGLQTPPAKSDLDVLRPGTDKRPAQTAPKTAAATGKTKCPSCEHSLPDETPVCTQCGIFIKSGRPILTSWDTDTDEIEEKAHGIVSILSWILPFGMYPVYSDAMGNHKPYSTWAITAVTVLISIWFLALDFSGSPQMMSAKNLMLWSSGAEPDADYILDFYDYTNYGDTQAFLNKRNELAEAGTTPEDQLDIAAHNALAPNQKCFGEYSASQLVTHAFLHAGIMHLAGNMLFLLVFGSRVNAAIGNIATAILYPILAVAAAMAHLASMGAQPPTPMLGASGAVMGLAGAYLLLYPINKVYMVIWLRWGLIRGFHLSFKCFALRGFWVVLFYIMFDVIAVSLAADDGTAHWAHIGGLLWGFVIAFGLIAARLAYSRSDVFSLILGKYAWPVFGTPASRIK